MNRKILIGIVLIMLVIFLSGCTDAEVEREYDLYQLNKGSERIVNKSLFGFLVFVTAKSTESEQQYLNFFYTLENGETREAICKDVNVNRISYIFIEKDEQPKVVVNFKRPGITEKGAKEFEDRAHIYNAYPSKITFYVPEGSIKKIYQVN